MASAPGRHIELWRGPVGLYEASGPYIGDRLTKCTGTGSSRADPRRHVQNSNRACAWTAESYSSTCDIPLDG